MNSLRTELLPECFPEKSSWCRIRNELVCRGVKCKDCFEQSNGLDTALHKKIPLLLVTVNGYSSFEDFTNEMCYVVGGPRRHRDLRRGRITSGVRVRLRHLTGNECYVTVRLIT